MVEAAPIQAILFFIAVLFAPSGTQQIQITFPDQEQPQVWKNVGKGWLEMSSGRLWSVKGAEVSYGRGGGVEHTEKLGAYVRELRQRKLPAGEGFAWQGMAVKRTVDGVVFTYPFPEDGDAVVHQINYLKQAP